MMPATVPATVPTTLPAALASGLPAKMQSGGLTLASPFILAPMEGVSDVGFRRLCFAAGAGLTYTEMVRARGIAGRNKATLDLIDTFDPTTLTGVQLMATGPEELRKALAVLDELAQSTHPHFFNIQAIDLNFGCPSPDIIRIGAGPALLKRRSRLRAIFEVLALWKTTTPLPVRSVSAKIRLGLHAGEQEHKVYMPVVDLANDTLDHLVVHGRHARQRSRDAPTWSAIGEVKAKSRIPVIGNGDVFDRAAALRMYTQTGCDGFLIARAAIKDPWCFRAFNGTGTAATLTDVEEGEQTYRSLAAQHGTKEKFRAFHEAAFVRLRETARSGHATDVAIPKNAHMW